MDGWLAGEPGLPTDLRQKVLQVRDELERAVRIRQRYGDEGERGTAGGPKSRVTQSYQ